MRSNTFWKRVSKNHPCSICGKTRHCLYTADHIYPPGVVCARDSTGKPSDGDDPTWRPQQWASYATLPGDPLQHAFNYLNIKAVKSEDGWLVSCPVYDDQQASLSIEQLEDGEETVLCDGPCSQSHIQKELDPTTLELFPQEGCVLSQLHNLFSGEDGDVFDADDYMDELEDDDYGCDPEDCEEYDSDDFDNNEANDD